jgi:predicted permease
MEEAGFHTTVEPLQDLFVRDVRGSLYALWAGALFVVLIGAVNLANLALAQSRLRAREQALRMTLGAGRTRVARLLTFEGLMIAAAGGVLGIVVGAVALRIVGTVRIDRFFQLDGVGLDWSLVGFVLVLALASGLLVVLASLAHVKNDKLVDVLRSDRHTGASGERARTIRRTLVIAQVALAFVLVVGAVLLSTTVRNLLNVDAGFSRDNIVTGTLPFEGPRYNYDQAAVFATIDSFLERIRGVPGVVAAGATTLIPLGGGRVNVQAIVVEGNEQSADEPLAAPWAQVTPGFFETMGTPLTRGRSFDERDNAAAPGVVIIDERLANRLWPDTDPIGKRLFMPGIGGNAAVVTESTKWLTIVGVVPEVRLYGLAGNESSVGSYYTPHKQSAHRYYTFAIKSPLDPAIVMQTARAELAAIDPDLVPFGVQTMTDRTNQSLGPERRAERIGMY